MKTSNLFQKYPKKSKVSRESAAELRDELDFQYLLQLMGPLSAEPAYASLPELFSIIGVDSLILLCKYAGGETIKIPTLAELSHSIEALEWYYNVYIAHCKDISDIPLGFQPLVDKIATIYKDA